MNKLWFEVLWFIVIMITIQLFMYVGNFLQESGMSIGSLIGLFTATLFLYMGRKEIDDIMNEEE